MRFYHRTRAAAASQILRDGFRDGSRTYLTDQEFSGVWVSANPDDGYCGVLLEIDLDLDQALIDQYEWIEEGKTHREWLIPSSLLNAHATVRLVSEE